MQATAASAASSTGTDVVATCRVVKTVICVCVVAVTTRAAIMLRIGHVDVDVVVVASVCIVDIDDGIVRS